MVLYRPVGLKELELIAQADFAAFPPRLPEQPIFYPVLNFEYAEQIARDWNTKGGTFAGFVTRFEVKRAYAEKFEIHTVGARIHQELWVPAEDLAEFNSHIVGQIEVMAAYYGEQFHGETDPATNLPSYILHGMASERATLDMNENNRADITVAVPRDDPDMQQAYLEARRTIEQFIRYLQSPTLTQGYFGVKVRITGADRDEYFWMSDVAYDGGAFIGKIEGESNLLRQSKKAGDNHQARLDEIYDWMIVDNGKLVGGYTIRMARSKMTPENRERFDAALWFTVE